MSKPCCEIGGRWMAPGGDAGIFLAMTGDVPSDPVRWCPWCGRELAIVDGVAIGIDKAAIRFSFTAKEVTAWAEAKRWLDSERVVVALQAIQMALNAAREGRPGSGATPEEVAGLSIEGVIRAVRR